MRRFYHLNAYTYADPAWFPDMPADLRAYFQKETKGIFRAKPARKRSKTSRLMANMSITLDKHLVGIPFLDAYIEKASIDYLTRNAKSAASRSS